MVVLVAGCTVVSSSQVVSAVRDTLVVLDVGKGGEDEVTAGVTPWDPVPGVMVEDAGRGAEVDVPGVTLKLPVPNGELVRLGKLAVGNPVGPLRLVEFDKGYGRELGGARDEDDVNPVPRVELTAEEPEVPVTPVAVPLECGREFVGPPVDGAVEFERG